MILGESFRVSNCRARKRRVIGKGSFPYQTILWRERFRSVVGCKNRYVEQEMHKFFHGELNHHSKYENLSSYKQCVDLNRILYFILCNDWDHRSQITDHTVLKYLWLMTPIALSPPVKIVMSVW